MIVFQFEREMIGEGDFPTYYTKSIKACLALNKEFILIIIGNKIINLIRKVTNVTKESIDIFGFFEKQVYYS